MPPRRPATEPERRPVVRGRKAPLAVAVMLVAFLVIGSNRQPDTRTGGPRPSSTEAANAGPASNATKLTWRTVSGAKAYDVILWRDGKRMLDLWPTTASVVVPAGRLRAGRYSWFVYPVLSVEAKRFGRLAGHGTIRI